MFSSLHVVYQLNENNDSDVARTRFGKVKTNSCKTLVAIRYRKNQR